jgi:hypothetical protein
MTKSNAKAAALKRSARREVSQDVKLDSRALAGLLAVYWAFALDGDMEVFRLSMSATEHEFDCAGEDEANPAVAVVSDGGTTMWLRGGGTLKCGACGELMLEAEDDHGHTRQFHMLRVAQYVDRNEMADVGSREPLW